MTKALPPVSFKSFMSVSMPAVNMSIITPISAVFLMKSVISIKPRQLGPRMIPASKAPTT